MSGSGSILEGHEEARPLRDGLCDANRAARGTTRVASLPRCLLQPHEVRAPLTTPRRAELAPPSVLIPSPFEGEG